MIGLFGMIGLTYIPEQSLKINATSSIATGILWGGYFCSVVDFHGSGTRRGLLPVYLFIWATQAGHTNFST